MKPDIILIAEPWMHVDKFPAFWLDRLNLKQFVFNNRGQQNPNLWCICKKDLNPTIIECDSQHVSFSVEYMNNIIGIAAVYASNKKELVAQLNFFFR